MPSVPMGFYMLQTEDGRDVILLDGIDTTEIDGNNIAFSEIKDSMGYKGYMSRLFSSGSGSKFERTEENLSKLRHIVGLIEMTLGIEIRLFNVDVMYEVKEI